MDLLTNINELIQKVLKIKELESIEREQRPKFYDPFSEESIKQIGKISEHRIKLENLLLNYDAKKVKEIYTFYYYGRDEIAPSTSYSDLIKEHEKYSLDEMIRDITSFQFYALKKSWERAREKFEEHEESVPKEKENLKKRIRDYTKKEDNSYFKFPKRDGSSTHSTFKNIQELFGKETNDIYTSKNIIEEIINQTTGKLVVDFLGTENFDHLDFVECDDAILKLYWKYSNGDNMVFTHNIRIDIAFDKLEFIENVGVVLKGLYKSKKELREYYFNKEGITNKLHSPAEIEEREKFNFYYRLNFDKKQRGSLENFEVTFLPWRYYNILILPRENLPSKTFTSQFLIRKNLLDIKFEIEKSIKKFKEYPIDNEHDITMFGNRFRKSLEALLKFILLASNIMFKENYEKDMLGSILEQLKEALANQSSYHRYDKDILPKVIKKVENNLLTNLNLCSHYNVKHKIDSQIIFDIYDEINKTLELSFECFNLTSE